MSPEAASAVAYWRACCAIAGAHAFGCAWPLDGGRPVRAPRGHWGANPGVAWIVGHLASHWDRAEPLEFVIGTGHATSFVLAHEALSTDWPPARLNKAILEYGVPGGSPSELIDLPSRTPHLFGELGAAVGVAQGLSKATGRCTACVIGDGECETPATLAALAHGQVLLTDGAATPLVAINANGARMGGEARFQPGELGRLLRAMGYAVFRSDERPKAASARAREALASALAGRPTLWISATSKGWPAPDPFGDRPFRGAAAHKVPTARDPSDPVLQATADLVAELARESFSKEGRASRAVRATASRISLSITPQPPRSALRRTPRRRTAWSAPIAAVDEDLAARAVQVFSPDEAASNGLHRCLAAGLVTEVLAEEVCLAWAIGHVAAGREAVLATYEAFAPLVGSQLAQYAKLVAAQDLSDRPPLGLVLTSLGWANAPTHRNSDLAATFLNRASERFRLICPLGAASASRRLRDALDRTRGGAFALVCSKQPLLNLPDPGGSVVRLFPEGNGPPDAVIVTCGDICATEAVGALALAAERGRRLEVWAVAEPTALAAMAPGSLALPDAPVIAAVWCASATISGPLWRAAGRMFPIHDGECAQGATPWEHLASAGLDRYSLLNAALPETGGGPAPLNQGPYVVPPFTAPALQAERRHTA